jgi:flavin reductase (DIM6/NTAB) family NADH-FMN oxidoreductase RutF
MDEMLLRNVYSCFPSGVVTMCAAISGQFVGMTLSTFIPVSLKPPLVAVSVRKESTTWPLLKTAPRLGVAIMAAGQESAARQMSSSAENRFKGVEMAFDRAGAAWIVDAPAALTCSVQSEVDAGDHVLVLLVVQSVVRHGNCDPLVFHERGLRPLRGALPDLAIAKRTA